MAANPPADENYPTRPRYNRPITVGDLNKDPTITDEEMYGSGGLSIEVVYNDKKYTMTVPDGKIQATVEQGYTGYISIKLNDTLLTIETPEGKSMPFKILKVDSGPYNFMHFLFLHQNTDIGRGTIQSLPGCASYKNLTEAVRACGFDKRLKKLFFPSCQATTLRFTPTVPIGEIAFMHLQADILGKT